MSQRPPHLHPRQFGPVMGWAAKHEMLRAAIGAFCGLLLIELFLAASGLGAAWGLRLIAPFGASCFLIFAVPNSPLAQPWSAIVGNSVAAIAGVTAVLFLPDPYMIPAAVGGAVLAMHLARALHPPGGAVALTAGLSPDLIRETGYAFVISPVFFGTLLLVLVGMIYAPLTGRRYPFRQSEPPHELEPEEEPAREPLGLSREALADLLSDFRQTPNIGVEDLARLIAAAEDRAASLRLGNLTCGEIMTRDPVAVDIHTTLPRIAALFAQLGYTALPVTDGDRHFRGMIFQIHLIRRAVADAAEESSAPRRALHALFGRSREVSAGDIMRSDGPRLQISSPAVALLPLLAEGIREAVPILDNDRLVGIVTRTDLLARLEEELVLRG